MIQADSSSKPISSKKYLIRADFEAIDAERDSTGESGNENDGGGGDDDQSAHNCVCDHCGKSPIFDYRYHCLKCSDYDLCSRCFESRKFTGSSSDHERGHPWLRFDSPRMLHGERLDSMLERQLNLSSFLRFYQNQTQCDYKCGACGADDFKGARFSCEECGNYTLCASCFKDRKTSKSHKLDHVVIAHGKVESLTVNEQMIEYIEEIGKGGFGTVFKARLKTNNKLVACKIIGLSSGSSMMTRETLEKSFYDEMSAYQKIKGKNILRMVGYFETGGKNSDAPYTKGILTEYMHRGSLRQTMETATQKGIEFSDRRRLDILVQIASGMARIHDLGFIHRDIRPDNILVDSRYRAKIGDMGIAKLFMGDATEHTRVGAGRYMPPEFQYGNISLQLDVFTFGLTTIELFSGSFTNKNGDVTIETSPSQLEKLAELCIMSDPDKRPRSRWLFGLLTKMQAKTNNYLRAKNYSGNQTTSSSSTLKERNALFSKALGIYQSLMYSYNEQSDDNTNNYKQEWFSTRKTWGEIDTSSDVKSKKSGGQDMLSSSTSTSTSSPTKGFKKLSLTTSDGRKKNPDCRQS